jgi:predicted amidohydrolase YtcJ
MILKNGRIWTGNGYARSVTIEGNRIAALDRDDHGIDLGGRLVVPGFIDNHVHFGIGSLQLERVQLRDARSAGALAEKIGAHARKIGAGRWIVGGNWDEQRWNPPVPPSRRDLDGVTPDNPVFVTRNDLHMGVANGVALRLAGITRDTPDPAGGTIERDASGEPTGLLKDAAMPLLTSVIPLPTPSERKTAMQRGLQEAARCGVTSFCDMGMTAEAFDDFQT